MRKVRIYSEDAMARKCQITDKDTGQKIDSVRSVKIEMDINKGNIAILEIVLPTVDIEAMAVFHLTCPHCKKEIVV